MTMYAYAQALTKLQEKANFNIVRTMLYTNFGDRENNVVLAGYGPEGEAVYAEIKD